MNNNLSGEKRYVGEVKRILSSEHLGEAALRFLCAIWLDCLASSPLQNALRIRHNVSLNQRDILFRNAINSLTEDLWSNALTEASDAAADLNLLFELNKDEGLVISQPSCYHSFSVILFGLSGNPLFGESISCEQALSFAINSLNNDTALSVTMSIGRGALFEQNFVARDKEEDTLLYDWLRYNHPGGRHILRWVAKSSWLVRNEDRRRMLAAGRGRRLAWEMARQLEDINGWMEALPEFQSGNIETWFASVDEKIEELPDLFDWILNWPETRNS